MPSFTQLLAIASLALVGSAALVVRSDDDAFLACDSPSVVSDSTIQAGNLTIQVQDFSCGDDADTGSLSRRGIFLFDQWPLCLLFHSCYHPAPTVKNVCGEICSNSCTLATDQSLPPISADCQQIADALVIFNGIQSSTFVTSPGHITKLTSGTCTFSFANLRKDLVSYESCWTDLSTHAQSAASACFPPIQPVNSAGTCTSSDGTWNVAASHS